MAGQPLFTPSSSHPSAGGQDSAFFLSGPTGIPFIDGGAIRFLQSVNRGFEEITGYLRADILGRSCATLNCSPCEIAREENGCHWCVMFRKGNLSRQRCTLIRKDGRVVTILKNATVIKDGDGSVTGAVETMTDITELVSKKTEIEHFRRELRGEDRFQGMIGVSAAMRRVFDLVANAAQSDTPLIIAGESGTGKELVAQAIHQEGKRQRKPFLKVNCAALNQSLLESELFGHVKGAFTGAFREREGRFEAAEGGDIFLDEIGDLPLPTQVKFRRVLEEKAVERVGENRPRPVDVRIISATNRNLAQLMERGTFREDFFIASTSFPSGSLRSGNTWKICPCWPIPLESDEALWTGWKIRSPEMTLASYMLDITDRGSVERRRH